jgi:hypothetical protein
LQYSSDENARKCVISVIVTFFLLENTPTFEYGGEAPTSHKERQVHMEKEKGGGKNRECL